MNRFLPVPATGKEMLDHLLANQQERVLILVNARRWSLTGGPARYEFPYRATAWSF